jgi:hypothetical protein
VLLSMGDEAAVLLETMSISKTGDEKGRFEVVQ